MMMPKKPMSEVELKALLREGAVRVIAGLRADGLSDAEIEKKLGRRLPLELRRPTGGE